MNSVLASGPTNYTAITIALGIPVAVLAAIAVIVWSYFRLQRHRADAVAMAHYRTSGCAPGATRCTWRSPAACGAAPGS
jgi:hypothetical protein